jgi:inhibitor of cysteine peptidase
MRRARFWRGGLAAALAIGVVLLGASHDAAAQGDQTPTDSFCGQAPDPPAGATDNAVAATVGVPFTITLDSNPTTGYSWDLAQPIDPNVLDLVDHHYQRADSPPAAPGAPPVAGRGGTELWTFEPLCAGFTTVVLRYRRPWEPNDPTAKEAAYDVFIH